MDTITQTKNEQKVTCFDWAKASDLRSSMFAPDVNRADWGFPHKESKGSCSKTSLVSQTCFSILYLECTHIPLYQCFFFVLFFFPILSICSIFLSFFSRIHTIKKKSQFLHKKIVATVRKFTKKNHCSVQNFFCFSTSDLFAMTVHVTFPSPPRLLQS